ncbi:MAG TPA: YihY family inner membrane protein [Usitatibacter sp.]|nr:YihY family inner membrane protein [Usitatibacter sp.]
MFRIISPVLSKLLDFAAFLRFALRRWNEDRCPQIAGSLAFTTMLALVPSFAIVVVLMSRAPFFDQVMAQIHGFLRLNLVPAIADRIINVYMAEFAANAGRLTTLGAAILLVTSIALMLTIDRSINAIWRTRRKRPIWISVAAYLALLIVGPVLIGASVSITTYLMSLPSRLSSVPAPAHSFLLQAVPTAVSTLAFFLIYRLVPHRTVPWPHALAGGFLAAVLFEVAKEGLAFYVTHMPIGVVYGTFAALPVFLLWIYFSWLIVLFGAEMAASLGEWGTREELRGETGKAEEPGKKVAPLRKAKRGRARSGRFSR